jgi:sulfocyanin
MERIRSIGSLAMVALLGAVLAGAETGGAAATAAFSIVAGQGAANGGLNFNGTDKGRLIITVPVGAVVKLTLINKGDLPHSLQVIPFTTALPATAVKQPAFPGAETPHPDVGIMKGQTAAVQFTATKPGKYLLICGFPGHALLGMYASFEVSPSASVTPGMVVKK